VMTLTRHFAALLAALFLLSPAPKAPPHYPSGFRLPFEGYVRITAGPGDGMHTNRSSEAYDFQSTSAVPFPVLAVASGTAYSQSTADFGNVIMIDHGNGLWSLYAHLSSIRVPNGRVEAAQFLGDSGSTGTYSNHLHFEILQGVAFRGGLPDPYSGTSIPLDSPQLHYSPSPNCCNRGSADGEPSNGRWEGTVQQSSPAVEIAYSMSIDLNACLVGRQCGTSTYWNFPDRSGSCSGILTLTGVGSNQYDFSEHITSSTLSRGRCVDDAFTLRRGSGTSWSIPGFIYRGDRIGTASLTKTR
jgi:hypothetical protein